jgi:hypothetical protein
LLLPFSSSAQVFKWGWDGLLGSSVDGQQVFADEALVYIDNELNEMLLP